MPAHITVGREDELELTRLQESEIELAQTALGEEHSKNISLLLGGIESGSVPKDSLDALKKALEESQRSTTGHPTMEEYEGARNNDNGL